MNCLKNLLLAATFLFASISMYAQAPAGFNYQTVVRNASGAIIQNTGVSIRFSIIKGDAVLGNTVYQETHNTSTNANGLVNVVIGEGTGVSGVAKVTDIDWAGDAYFLKIEVDPAGGSSYVDMGTTQFMSVPYALSSGDAPKKIAFKSHASANQQFEDDTMIVVKYNDEAYDFGDNYDPATATFTVPEDGIYHFDLNIVLQAVFNSTNTYFELRVIDSGTASLGDPRIRTLATAEVGKLLPVSLSTDLNLQAGDKVFVNIYSFGVSYSNFCCTNFNTFSGHKLF